MDSEKIENIRNALHKYPKESVDKFLVELVITSDIRDRLMPAREISDHRKTLTRMRKNMEVTLADLKTIRSRNFNIIPQKSFQDTEGQEVARRTDASFFSAQIAARAYDDLKELVDIIQSAENALESQKPRRGREKADSQGIYTEVKELFEKRLGKVSSYEAHPFAEVMGIITGHDDTRRGVSQAIRPAK